jgi:hypothetical protein
MTHSSGDRTLYLLYLCDLTWKNSPPGHAPAETAPY